MKNYFIFAVIYTISCTQITRADDKADYYKKAVNEYHEEQIKMSNNIIIMELVYSKSKSLEEYRRNCMPGAFCGLTVMSLAIEGLGVNTSPAASDVLVDLIVTTLDAGASEDLDCAIVIKGNKILPQLEDFNIENSLSNCNANFSKLKKSVLRTIDDVSVNDICQLNKSRHETIKNRVHDLIQSIKSKTVCE
ncbi:Imm57 family immunity protein [Mixta intestinalis]|uniref:Uncharacterized protein n=1 Tax=Mixta intestinalis TaxID=1615494 RepID=A0A6P1PVT5_9GAMM|nr:Imm57 family immunity protein [Mixta intestinalis]QHM70616.1 hypothetical protein C7M51_00894 [Mixta intestinalis]